MSRTLFWLSLLFVVGATANYTLGPIVIRLKNSASVNPTFDEIPDEHARALFPPNFFNTIYELEASGFSLVCHLSSSTIVSRVHGMISLLVNRSTNTFATITFARTLKAAKPIFVNYTEFFTEFADGFKLDTTNSSTVTVFYEPPFRKVIKVPHLNNPTALYQVHLYLVKSHGSKAILPAAGTEKEYFVEAVKKSLAEQVDLGFYFLDAKSQRYRHTWRGAYHATYRLLWPMKQIIQRRQERTGRVLAAEAAAAGYWNDRNSGGVS